MKNRPSAFTLVEILASLTIMAILVVLLFPSYRSFRLKAAGVQCIANLKKLIGAHIAYQQEYNGLGPPVAVGPSDGRSEGHNISGFCLLRIYYRPGPRYNWTYDHQRIIEPTEYCPAGKLTGQVNGGDHLDYNYAVPNSNYIPGTPPIPLTFRQFTNHAASPVIWDGWKPKGSATQLIPLRHLGGANVAFLDGHVERLSGDDGKLYEDYMWQLYNNGVANSSKERSGRALGSNAIKDPNP